MVKFGTHKIGTHTYAINIMLFLFGNAAMKNKSVNMGVERGVATRGTQSGVAYDDSYCINFDGFTRQ